MKRMLLALTLLTAFLFLAPPSARAATVTWDGGAATSNWSDAANWNPDGVPDNTSDVVIDTAVTVNLAATTTINSLVLGVSGGGTASVLNFAYDAITSGALVIDDGNLTVYSGASITHPNSTTSVAGRVYIDVQTGSATITGSINLAAKGYSGGYGEGKGVGTNRGSGGGYGGEGGYGNSLIQPGGSTYGSLEDPTDLGSGGAETSQGSPGGGSVKLEVNTTLTINGSITATGGNNGIDKPSGSGGSINLTAATITGSGTINATGGGNANTCCVGAGGGGRIALYYTNYSFNGTLLAAGNTGYGYSGSGTIYQKPSGQTYGNLLVDNNNLKPTYDEFAGNTPLGSHTFDTITVRNYGRLEITSNTNVTYTTLDWATKGLIFDNHLDGVLAPFTNSTNLTIPATSILYANVARTHSSLTIEGTLTHSNNATSQAYVIDLNITNDCTVESGGAINVVNAGYWGGNGDGAGTGTNRGGGGGHGGTGGDGPSGLGGGTYDSLENPTLIGSGGGTGGYGERGGGAIKLVVGGTLDVSGEINANGGDRTAIDHSGGAGGSIYLIINNLTGSSNITANGGLGHTSYTGGGGGGRIAIYYTNTNSHSGSVTVTGGVGYNNGQDGTKLIKASGGELISSPFDTGDPATLIYDLTWSENLETGTDAKFQLRTAPDSSGSPGTWTDWFGPSGAGTYYTDPTGVGESIYSTHSDASSDQWVQYKAIFTAPTDSQDIPTISDLTITYVVNTAPTVTITNSPTLSSSGEYTVTYTLSDPEESTLTSYLAADVGITIGSDLVQSDSSDLAVSNASFFPTSGTIVIDNEMLSYTGKSGNTLTGITRGVNSTTDTTHLSGSSVWLVATGVTGDIGGGQSLLGTKSVTWTPTTDLANLETATAQVKIIVNDGNLANQIASDSVNSVTLDTKAPTSGDLFIDKYTGVITLTASDTNAVFYKASNSSDLTADGVNANSGTWQAYTASVSWTFASDPSTVYLAYKDAYGNTTSTYSTVSPTRLSSLIIQDASNPETSEWRLFVSWVVATDPALGFAYYQIYRSTDGTNYSAYQQIATKSQNYYVDTGLDNTTTYYYKVTIVDNHGNESDTNYPIQTSGSASRSGVGLTPDGSGGGDFTAPTISGISTSSLTTSSVTITWDTDELSDSTVGYSEDTSYDTEFGSISMVSEHSLTLNNLTPDTKYYFRVISADALYNKATAENSGTYFFTTLADTTGPVISDIKATVGETTAAITWATNEPGDSLLEYSTDTSYSESSSSATLAQGHALGLTALTAATTYNYRVTSEDQYGNSTTSPSYTFTTSASSTPTTDSTAPTISNIGVSEITATSAKVSWNTSEDADGKVEYGESTSYERGIAEGNHTYTTSKSVTLIGLSPETTYHYKIQVVDEAGNTNTSADATFTTAAQSAVSELTSSGTTSGTGAPSITSESPAVTEITGTTATIGWETNKKATSEVYYKIKNSLGSPLNSGSVTYVTAHSVNLTNLAPATTYEYQVKSTDVNGNYVTSAKYEFTTTLPGVASVRVTAKNESTATIEWLTSTPTTTIIEYTNTQTRETKTYSNSSLVTAHLATLTDLIPSTAYVFEVVISDEAGNLARSDQYSFVTDLDNEGPTISAVNNRSTIIAGQNKVQTVITWVTNEPTTSQVEYGLGSGVGDYEQATDINEDYVANHIMVIANLKPGSVYRYRVKSADRAGNEAVSDPFVLLTPLREVSALDLIIQNLEGAFGWLNNIRR